ncbi:hypothetical protein J3F83DRAFT_437613 [Trichoderma novae-zelandiae]
MPRSNDGSPGIRPGTLLFVHPHHANTAQEEHGAPYIRRYTRIHPKKRQKQRPDAHLPGSRSFAPSCLGGGQDGVSPWARTWTPRSRVRMCGQLRSESPDLTLCDLVSYLTQYSYCSSLPIKLVHGTPYPSKRRLQAPDQRSTASVCMRLSDLCPDSTSFFVFPHVSVSQPVCQSVSRLARVSRQPNRNAQDQRPSSSFAAMGNPRPCFAGA